jgi:uncharacterized OB-fold protein
VYDHLKDFIEKLSRGKFEIPRCNSCNTKVWPPYQYCPQCHSKTALEAIDTIGTLLEFTKSSIEGMQGTFGLVDMSGIKLVGSFNTSELREGQKVKMVRCGINSDGVTFYSFEPLTP